MESRTHFEEGAYEKGHRLIAGVDEAGRGPLAGSVVAAACVLPKGLILEGVDDSKKLPPGKREELYQVITEHPDILYGIGIVNSEQIDSMNILQASLHAMNLAVENLPEVPDYLLIDGNHLPPTRIAALAVIKGDSRSQSIGAASILAKYTRDALMLQLHEEWPMYGFDKHKGYGTKAHVGAIHMYGPCPIHRRSFEPIKSMVLVDATCS